jgi:dTDP-4-amino-4,6-dideoxygalactose transaminase
MAAKTHEPIPLAAPLGEAQMLRSQIASALMRVIDGGQYVLGPEVANFEKALAASVEASAAIGVASGTDALVLAMLGLGVLPGDEVITVSHTAGPTVAAIRMIGAVPVLVDIEEETYCLDPKALAAATGSRTRAIIAVHLYGHPARLDDIRAAAPGIPIIEDCAQAQGAHINNRPVGGLGDVACFSFFPTKNLGALGDGGAITCNDPDLADRIRSLRTYGWTRPQYAELEYGRCSRLDEIQAAILSVKLPALSGMIQRRRAIASLYREGLSGLPLTLPTEALGIQHAYHLYVVRTQRRDALEAHLKAQQIGTGRHYPLPVHRQPGLAAQARIQGPLTRTENISSQILSLPMFGTMTDAQVSRVVSAVQDFFA